MKKILWLVLLLSVIILTGCLPKKKGTVIEEGAKTGQEAGEEESYFGNLEKMMGLGVPLKCSWKQDENYHG